MMAKRNKTKIPQIVATLSLLRRGCKAGAGRHPDKRKRPFSQPAAKVRDDKKIPSWCPCDLKRKTPSPSDGRNIIAVAAVHRPGAGRLRLSRRGRMVGPFQMPAEKGARMTKRVTLQPGDLVCYNVGGAKETSLAHVVEVRHPKQRPTLTPLSEIWKTDKAPFSSSGSKLVTTSPAHGITT